MKADIADAWIAALRSGEFKQTQMALNNGVAMCCLGVLCELHSRETGTPWNKGCYFHEDAELPLEVAQWARMRNIAPGILKAPVTTPSGVHGVHLAELNDNGASFVEIADVIEKHKDQL